MKTQGITGQSTEQKVRDRLRKISLEFEKPMRDIGVDLEVWHPENSSRRINIQIKGRGKAQKNGRYRWFQIRTTEKQRADAKAVGWPNSEAWQKKVALCQFFVLVSEKEEEYWVFPAAIIKEIININKMRYGERKDNSSGKQAEMDLDIEYGGKKLTEIYREYKDNFALIKEMLNSA